MEFAKFINPQALIVALQLCSCDNSLGASGFIEFVDPVVHVYDQIYLTTFYVVCCSLQLCCVVLYVVLIASCVVYIYYDLHVVFYIILYLFVKQLCICQLCRFCLLQYGRTAVPNTGGKAKYQSFNLAMSKIIIRSNFMCT